MPAAHRGDGGAAKGERVGPRAEWGCGVVDARLGRPQELIAQLGGHKQGHVVAVSSIVRSQQRHTDTQPPPLPAAAAGPRETSVHVAGRRSHVRACTPSFVRPCMQYATRVRTAMSAQACTHSDANQMDGPRLTTEIHPSSTHACQVTERTHITGARTHVPLRCWTMANSSVGALPVPSLTTVVTVPDALQACCW